MDLRQFYRKIREVKATIADEFVFIASLETPDGGRDGVVNEVTRETAARLIVEGKAAIASSEQVEGYQQALATAKQRLDKAEIAKRIQVAIISEPEERLQPRRPATK
jgi:hypothetical protein